MNFLKNLIFTISFMFATLPTLAETPDAHIETPHETIIVTLGDSLTEGYGLAQEEAYPGLVQKILNDDGYAVAIVNSSISGSTTSSAHSRITWILKQKPNVIFLALGANDGLRGVSFATIKKNLLEAIQLAKKNHVEIWLAGMKLPPNYGKRHSQGFEQIFTQVSKDENVPLLPFLLEGVAGDPNLNLTDQIHPNEKGHKKLALLVSNFFKSQLKKKK